MSSSDFPGHLTSKAKPVLIIDLDETLISVNSFPLWAKYFLLGRFDSLTPAKRAVLRIKAAKIFASRKILKHSHAKTKRDLHKIWVAANDISAQDNLLSKLEQNIRPNMQKLLQLIATKEIDAVLATAAASAYAEPFARKIGFTYVIATGISDSENRSEEKSRRAIELITKNNWQDREKIFFTDHLEDMPFMKNSDKLIWFGKDGEIEQIKSNLPDLKIFSGKNMGAQDIINNILQ